MIKIFNKSLVLSILFFMLFGSTMVFAAGSCTIEESETGYKKKWLTYICTADSADGTISNTVIIGLNDFFLYSVETWPGGTAPTDDSDYTLSGLEGEDLMGGNGADSIDATDKKTKLPRSAAMGLNFYHVIKDNMILVISNNSVNSAIINVRITGVR